MNSALRLLLLTVFVAFVGMRAAMAETPREQAGQHVVKGDALKAEAEAASKAGDSEEASRLFDSAAEEYQAAYDLVPHPLMLYNLAQVYRLGGRLEEALVMYTDFLASNPTGTAADFARKYQRILQRTVGDGPADDDDDVSDDDDDLGDDDDDIADDDDDDLGDDDDDDIGGGGSSGGEKGIPGKALKFGGLAMAVAGVVSLGFGVKYGLEAKDIANCLGANYPAGCSGLLSAGTIQSGQWTDEADALEKDTLPATKNKMFIFGGIGAAAIVGGAFVYFLGDDKIKAQEARHSLQLTPQVSEQSTGIALSGSF